MFKDRLLMGVLKGTILMVASFAMAHFASGVFMVALVVLGVCCAFAKRTGLALCCFMFMAFFPQSNPIIIPKTTYLFIFGARLGFMVIAASLIVMSNAGRSRFRIPLALLTPYLLVALFSSAVGWLPKVSYMKLVQFVFFMLAIWLGTQNLSDRPKELWIIRLGYLSFATFVVYGSLAIWPWPSISTLDGLQKIGLEGGDIAAAAADLQETLLEGGHALFCGLTNQSQCLAPVLACCFAFVACDMLFIEGRMRTFHVVLLVSTLVALFLTRSRVGLFSATMGILFVSMYVANRIFLPERMKKKVKQIVTACLVLIALAGVMSQLTNQTMSRWLRKTDDVKHDNRSLSEAVTSSRQGLIEQSMSDFRHSPLIGTGFQVSEQMAHSRLATQEGLILSAPIEKGLLPIMILGETGIVGAVIFVMFIITFWQRCQRKRLYMTNAMFAVLLATNMGEAGFFAPGGEGGLDWQLTIVGGFILDLIQRQMRNGTWPYYDNSYWR